jgi:hypothetical protein
MRLSTAEAMKANHKFNHVRDGQRQGRSIKSGQSGLTSINCSSGPSVLRELLVVRCNRHLLPPTSRLPRVLFPASVQPDRNL